MAEFSTNPGDRSVTELEREVDRERERVSATIDELQARASVGSLVDQLVKAVGENGGEVSRNLGRSLRDNPLAALLTGVGLAWLMAGSGKPPDEGQDWEDPDREYLRYEARSLARDVATRRCIRKQRPRLVAELRVPRSRCRIRRRAAFASALPTLRAGLAKGCRKLSKVCATAPQTSRIRRAPAALGPATPSARPAALSATGPGPHVGARPGPGDMRHGLDTLMEDQPLVVGAIAMALGAAVGGALPRSRVEDRMFGEQSDRAMETVRTLAKDQGAKVQATASAVVDEALNIADEASAELGARLPSGEEIVDAAESKVREAASRLREASGVETSQEPGGRPAV